MNKNISSFNRVNYFQQVSFESFKESCNIEYSADVVWSLQMYITNLACKDILTAYVMLRNLFA